ncbi:glycosyltransferase family 4 protein [Tenacibaculum finnmarkense]|uniref:glycosyltransferase family 4 protein n=1 Tax=Tenacibaculum finnmarkense TaxID=2781243 RepID=UPI001EFBD722|nr:glycosyltransferase family 4 protein [Tenacibaculum finnmarkense]MCG8883435.1 glycosyltransferase family 4 protein [Tenacibaculum finnmarkense]
MKREIVVFGYFGYTKNKLDGQTVKTRSILELLNKNEVDNITYIDSPELRFSLLYILNSFIKIIRCKKLVYIPAHNSLKYILPIFFIFSFIFNFKIYYFVVGGWLIEFLKKNKKHVFLLKNIELILPETQIVCNELINEFNFKNVRNFPNFRKGKNFIPSLKKVNAPIKLVYLGRIQEKKGISVILKLAKILLERNIDVVIDLYGQVDESYNEFLFTKLKSLHNINYKGSLLPEDIYGRLDEYDLMLFPTKYYTEGLPGTILDAYMSGIPVVATNWKHAKEFIDENITGIISNFNKELEFIDSVISLLNNPEKINEMKKSAYKKSFNFSETKAQNIIREIFFNK